MNAPTTVSTAIHTHRPPRLSAVLCASAAWRLMWAGAALALLWLTTLWALS